MVLTIGHGRLSADELTTLLRDSAVAAVVDVRRFPGSRRHPQFRREELEEWLPAAGIAYRWEERLGGRRRVRNDSRHIALRNDSFRAYADHMESAEWRAAMRQLEQESRGRRVAVMCSEAVWWRCHRRLIADAAVLLYDLPVQHLMHDGRCHEHPPTVGARIDAGELVYDRPDTAPGAPAEPS